MCSVSKTKTPDTRVQDAEAARQRALEEQRYNERLAAEQARWDAQRTADEQRYNQPRADQQAEIDRQRQAMDAEIARQQAAEQAAEGQREAERQAVLQQQQERAGRSRAWTDGRQALMTNAEADVNTAYGGFDDQFFNQFRDSFIAQHAPEIERQSASATRSTKMGAARRGTLASTGTARQYGDIAREKNNAQAQLAAQGATATDGFRSDIDAQRRSVLDSLFAAGGVGSESLPDGVTDVNSALGGLGAQLGALTQTARNRATALRAPSF